MAGPGKRCRKLPDAGAPETPGRRAQARDSRKLVHQVFEIVGPPVEAGRLADFVASEFQARVTARPPTVLPEGPPAHVALSRLGREITAVLADGNPWRVRHLVERMAGERRPDTVRKELKRLYADGVIQRPRFGVCMLAGLPRPAENEIPSLNGGCSLSPSALAVLDRLGSPTSSAALQAELGVSRQRVDQILKQLLNARLVMRVPEPGRVRRWLWMRAGTGTDAAIRRHVPSLASSQAALLNSLEPDAFHSIGDIASATGFSPSTMLQAVRRLEAGGLATSIRLGQRRYAAITPRGLEHASRNSNCTRVKASNMAKAFGPKQVAFLQALALLGEAKTADVTAALAGRAMQGAAFRSGAMVGRLLRSGLAERVPATQSKANKHAAYRLTEAGKMAAGLVSRDRRAPSRRTLLSKAAAYKTQRRERFLAMKAKNCAPSVPVAASPAQAALLKALEDGPVPASSLEAFLYGMLNSRSIHRLLKTLETRGVVEEAGREGGAKIWRLRKA